MISHPRHGTRRLRALLFSLAGSILLAPLVVSQPPPPASGAVNAPCGTVTALPAPGPAAVTRCYAVTNQGGENNCSPGITCNYGAGPGTQFRGSGPIPPGEHRTYCCPALNGVGRPIVSMSIDCPQAHEATCRFGYQPVENPSCAEAGGECTSVGACAGGGRLDLGRHDCAGEHDTCCRRE